MRLWLFTDHWGWRDHCHCHRLDSLQQERWRRPRSPSSPRLHAHSSVRAVALRAPDPVPAARGADDLAREQEVRAPDAPAEGVDNIRRARAQAVPNGREARCVDIAVFVRYNHDGEVDRKLGDKAGGADGVEREEAPKAARKVRIVELLLLFRVNTLSLVNFLRKPKIVHLLGAKCPAAVKTRWLYVYECYLFIISHKSDIESPLKIYQNESPCDSIPIWIHEIYWVLTPLKLFTLEIERKNSCLSWVPSLVKEVLNEWRFIFSKLRLKDSVDLLNVLSDNFIRRIKANAYCESISAYILTSFERNEIRKIETGFLVKNPVDIININPECIQHMSSKFMNFTFWTSNPYQIYKHLNIPIPDVTENEFSLTWHQKLNDILFQVPAFLHFQNQ